MNEREALKLALEALQVATTPLAKDRQEVLRAQAAIKEALAQPAQQHDYWQEEARRYAQNADFWRGKYEAAVIDELAYIIESLEK